MILHYFTYELDNKCLEVSLKRTRSLFPDSPIYVWDDASRPMDPGTVRTVESLATYKQTIFKRGGPMVGPEATEGILSCCAWAFGQHPRETHQAKLDPDVLIIRPDRITKAARDNVFYATWSVKGAPFSGMANVQSKAFVEEAAAAGALPGVTASMGEGKRMGVAALHLAAGREIRKWDYNPLSGYGASFQYEKAQIPLEEYVRRFDVITFGAKTCPTGRLEAALTMAKVSKWLEL